MSYNCVMLFGHIEEIREDKECTTITMRVMKPFRIFEDKNFDLINVELRGAIIDHFKHSNASKGNIMGLKGCLENNDNNLIVVADRLLFFDELGKEN